MVMHDGGLLGQDITPAESTRHTWDEENSRLAREYDLKVRQMELEVMKVEARFNNWFKIPLVVLKLPVYVIMGIGYCIAMARKHEPSDNFWSFLR
jgi:hypothetical protein